MNNTIELKSIAELLDGREFVVPNYQRGYRWTSHQIKDLLNDLYYFFKPMDKEGKFYCLQPIIVKFCGADNRFELVDGQQRLTSIYLIFRYLIHYYSFPNERNHLFQKLYRLSFDSRPEINKFLQKKTPEDWISLDTNSTCPIDSYYIKQAYKTIDDWFTKTAGSGLASDIALQFSKFLRQDKDSQEGCGSVQVIWYEIHDEKNLIREFLNINNGKIALNDAELVKALFLQKRNFENDCNNRQQVQKALEWEQIENALHADDFWYFLSPQNVPSYNRIELILCLASDVEKDALFTHYYSLFKDKKGTKLEEEITKQWQLIMDCFRLLEDWYLDPIKYNSIGYLIHASQPLVRLYKDFKKLNANSDFMKDFIYLAVKNCLGNKEKLPSYKDIKRVRNILLFININALNKQLKQLRSLCESTKIFNCPSYKFPFDIYIHQKWDVEHIDSRKGYELKNGKEKEEWVQLHESFFEHNEEFIAALKEKNWDKCIQIIKAYNEENETDEDKDDIGNLCLLDSETNRSFGNAIFPAKRARILKEISQGKFIPICTQMVFYKNFSAENNQSPRWDNTCKEAYHTYITQQIEDIYHEQ